MEVNKNLCKTILIKYGIYFILIGLIIWLITYGLFWLVLAVLFLSISYMLLVNLIKKVKNYQNTLKYLVQLFFAFVLVVGFNLFVGQIYKIPSQSMENTLFPEDVVLVNKLSYGPKLPRSPFDIPWISVLFYLNSSQRSKLEKSWWPHKRLKGIEEIGQKDLLVFQLSRTFFLVKRCIAVSGDTLIIDKGDILLNGKNFIEPLTVKKSYQISVKNTKKFWSQLDSVGLEKVRRRFIKTEKPIVGELSYNEKTVISALTSVTGIAKLSNNNGNDILFESSPLEPWSADNMGPFIVPREGMRIKLNEINERVYSKVLRQFESVKLTKKTDRYYLNGEFAEEYVFKQDYFFVLGDNRKNSLDSRYFGFIPKESIIGKVECVLFRN